MFANKIGISTRNGECNRSKNSFVSEIANSEELKFNYLCSLRITIFPGGFSMMDILVFIKALMQLAVLFQLFNLHTDTHACSIDTYIHELVHECICVDVKIYCLQVVNC